MIKEISDETDSKPDFNLILKGKLEIQINEKNSMMIELDITAKTLNQMIHKLLDKTTRAGLSKVNEALQFLVEKQGGS